MPLYGIDGLSPTVTTMTADATVVRTVYRLESGETVEVLQRRAGGTGPLFRTGTASATPAWSAVRGDLELTVIGAGPETIAERLRID
jgi:hypothetical protein